MARGYSTFKQGDVKKVVKALIAAGVEVARVEVDQDGRIVVVAGAGTMPAKENGGEVNEWDRM